LDETRPASGEMGIVSNIFAHKRCCSARVLKEYENLVRLWLLSLNSEIIVEQEKLLLDFRHMAIDIPASNFFASNS